MKNPFTGKQMRLPKSYYPRDESVVCSDEHGRRIIVGDCLILEGKRRAVVGVRFEDGPLQFSFELSPREAEKVARYILKRAQAARKAK